ncbi:MAG: hypothetical protein JO057_12225 [Chloroflexi bacterium]|nr:hypothetical protein [Chloroflexota bacterium]
MAVSINQQRILAYANLPRRVLKALCMLCLVLLVSTIGLVPGQPVSLLGLELLVIGVGGVILVVFFDLGTIRRTAPEFRRRLLLMPVGLLAMLCTAIAGVTLVAHAGGGLYWLVGMVVLAVLAALVDAWVLLIEIVR